MVYLRTSGMKRMVQINQSTQFIIPNGDCRFAEALAIWSDHLRDQCKVLNL